MEKNTHAVMEATRAVPIIATPLKPQDEIPPFGKHILWDLASWLDKLMIITGVGAAIGAGTVRPLMTLVFGQLVNNFNGRDEIDQGTLKAVIDTNALYFVYLFIGQLGLVWIYSMTLSYAATRLTRSLRLSYMRALITQDVAYLEDYTPGAVASDILAEASTIQTGFSETVGVAIQAVSTVLTSFIVAFSQSWRLALATSTSILALFVFLWSTDRAQARLGIVITRISSQSAGLIEEALSSITEVIAFGAKKKLQQKYEVFLDQIKNATVRKCPTSGAELGLTYFSLLSAYALAFWYGIRLLSSGDITNGGQVVIVILSINQATTALLNLLPSWSQVTKARVALKRFRTVITRKPQTDSFSTSGLRPADCIGRIELQEVNFSYPSRPDIQVLSRLSFIIEEGKTTAIIGPSGSGKTSIISLVERWYLYSSGKILIDGMSVDGLNEPFLFNDTIMENVAHGLSGTTLEYSGKRIQELVHQACVDANIDEFIQQLPLGYQTIVGVKGDQLSGGQKQRIAIARAIIACPRILVLDEATAALDPEGEKMVQVALDRVSKNRTTIVIAHKLSTIKNADKIVLLNHGQVVEEGSHRELLEKGGAYARLIRAQDLNRQFFDDDTITLNPLQKEQASLVGKDHTDEDNEIKRASSELTQLAQLQPKQQLSLTRCLWSVFQEHKPMRGLLAIGILTCLITGAVYPGLAVAFAKSISVFQYHGNDLISYGTFWALVWFVLALGMCVGMIGMGVSFTLLGILTLRHYRAEYLTILLSQDVSFFNNKSNSSGALTGRLIGQTNQLEGFLSTTLGFMVQIVVNLASCWILSLVVAWKLSLVAIFGSLPIILASGWLRIKVVAKIQHRNVSQYDETARVASEAIGAIKTVSSLSMEKQVCSRFANTLSGPVRRAHRSIVPNMALFALTQSAKLLGSALIFWYGGGLLAYRELNAFQLLLVYNAVTAGGDAAGTLFSKTNSIVKAHEAGSQIMQLRAMKPSINGSKGRPVLERALVGSIDLRDISFRYSTRLQAPVLKNLNLSIRPGQNIALVGPSGSGKSTIFSLLLRFYDVSSGTIYINGEPLTSLSVEDYRAHISVVSQQTILFQGTVRENILFGIKDESKVSEDHLVQVCKDANIHDFILSLPNGYNTQCGGKGLHFSGGQRQRLAIARALVRDPSILLLDEATSALDTESERIVLDALKKAAIGRSTITVAHRLSTIKNADKIHVLVEGIIKETGTHEELLRARGIYWAMCRAQSLSSDALQESTNE